MVIFKKPWRGYVPGERAGFVPEAEEVLVSAGYAVRNAGDPGLPGVGTAQERALAAAAAEGRPAPRTRPDAPGGNVEPRELLNRVGDTDKPASAAAAPAPTNVTRAADPETDADAARPEEIVGAKRRK